MIDEKGANIGLKLGQQFLGELLALFGIKGLRHSGQEVFEGGVVVVAKVSIAVLMEAIAHKDVRVACRQGAVVGAKEVKVTRGHNGR